MRPSQRTTPALLAAALTCLAPAAGSRADSVIEHYAHNYVAILTRAESSFVGATVTDTTGPIDDFAIAAPAFEPHPPYRDGVTTGSSLTPTTGAAKDIADGLIGLDFGFGTATTHDSFRITLSSDASASDARNSIGETSHAVVGLIARIGFFLDPDATAPAGTLVGVLDAEGLRAANDFESFSTQISESGAVIATILPGDPGLSIDLFTGRGYDILLQYKLDVPFGSDPSYSLAFGGGLRVVPEPSTLALLTGGLLLVAGLSRRARRPS